MDVGGNLKRIREDRGLTQQQLADLVAVSKPMICRVERGTKNLTVQLATQLAEALGCDLDDLTK